MAFHAKTARLSFGAVERFFLLDQGARFTAFDGLRAWAILSVFCVHFNADWTARKLDPSSASELIGTVTVSHLGVDLFFVLSGFLIYRLIVRTRPDFVTFMKDRYRRLLPAHVAVILAGVASSTLMVGIANILFLNLFIPSMPALNFVTWSLGYEISFYAIGGLALIAISNPRRPSVIVAAAVLALAACFALPPGWRDVGFFRIPDIRLMGFVFGMGGAMLYDSKLWPRLERLVGWLGLPGLVMCVALSAYVWPHSGSVFAKYPNTMKVFYLAADLGFTVVCLAAAARPANFINTCFSLKPLRMMGIVSYSFYLCHAKFGIPLGNQISERYFGGQDYTTSFLLGVAVSLLMSMFLFHFLEKPYFKRRSHSARIAETEGKIPSGSRALEPTSASASVKANAKTLTSA